MSALASACSAVSDAAATISLDGATAARMLALGNCARGLASAVRRVQETISRPKPAAYWGNLSATATAPGATPGAEVDSAEPDVARGAGRA